MQIISYFCETNQLLKAMTITLISFTSKNEKLGVGAHETLLSELEKYFTIKWVDYTQLNQFDKNEFALLFIQTGGVEHLITQQFHNLPHPAVMLTDGQYNSLPAAMEIAAWYRSKGLKSEILHGDLKTIVQRIFTLKRNFDVRRQLSEQRIGIIGTPSPWLVSSHVDYLLTKQRWGVEHINIPFERVVDIYRDVTDNQVGASCAAIASQALACRESTPEDMLKAMRLYRAVRQVCQEEQLNAVTINCKKLHEKTRATCCLALAMLNDEGITAGCEGDLQSLFTMLAVRLITGKSSFIGNLSQVNAATNNILLSHCSIGFKQTSQFILRSHFESNSSISIQGILPLGDATVVKCGGECLDKYYLSSGTILDNTNYLNLCRTQVQVHLDTDVSYFLEKAISNHHILVQGNHTEALESFFQSNTCMRIE